MIIENSGEVTTPGYQAIGYWASAIPGDLPYPPTTAIGWVVAALADKLLKGHLPNPRDYVDPSWDHSERDQVIAHLRAGRTLASWMGWSTCRICGCSNGSRCLTDGYFAWPAGFSHYLEAHAVRPPEVFVRHCIDKPQYPPSDVPITTLLNRMTGKP